MTILREGWNYHHDYPHQISYATLIAFGRVTVEMEADGWRHEESIYRKVEDWLAENDLEDVVADNRPTEAGLRDHQRVGRPSALSE